MGSLVAVQEVSKEVAFVRSWTAKLGAVNASQLGAVLFGVAHAGGDGMNVQGGNGNGGSWRANSKHTRAIEWVWHLDSSPSDSDGEST